MRVIFEKSTPGRRGVGFPPSDVPTHAVLPPECLRAARAELPEVSELEAVRHFTRLSQRNFSVDTHFYPLGSCTMKYNPKFCEVVARLEGFSQLHPLLPQLRRGGMLTQGALGVLYETARLLCEITGMAQFTMQPLAGAHGELTGAMIIAAYHRQQGNRKTRVIIPDSAHGTNPASAAIAGYEVVVAPTGHKGVLDAQTVEDLLSDDVAALMLTCPNTLGLFNSQTERLVLKDDIRVATSSGVTGVLTYATLDMSTQTLRSHVPVTFDLTNGTVHANAFTMRSSEHIIVFRGKVRVHLDKTPKDAVAEKKPATPQANAKPEAATSGSAAAAPTGNPQ